MSSTLTSSHSLTLSSNQMTPTTMFAAVYHPGNERLVLNRHYPIRELEDNKVLLKVLAVGGS